MAKRFNNLNAALKFLRPPSGTGDGVAPDAPAGTQLKKFQDFKAGKVDLDYTRTAASLPGNIGEAALKPFALPSTSDDKYLVSFSARAKSAIATAGVTESGLGISSTVLTGAIPVVGFTPARAIVNNVTGTASTTATSKITGKTYKKKASASYTYPMGASTANPSYSQAKQAVIALVAAGEANRGVSFTPENFR